MIEATLIVISVSLVAAFIRLVSDSAKRMKVLESRAPELPPQYDAYPVQSARVRTFTLDPPESAQVIFNNYDPEAHSGVLDLSCDDCGEAITEWHLTTFNSEGELVHMYCPEVQNVYGDGRVIRRFVLDPPDTSWVITEIVKW